MILSEGIQQASEVLAETMKHVTDSVLLEKIQKSLDALSCFAEDSGHATEEEIELARELHGSDECEIDNGALASRSDDGMWVSAWVWLPGAEEEDS